MARSSASDLNGAEHDGWQSRGPLSLLLLAVIILSASGCQGCSRDGDTADVEQKDKAPVEAFESSELEVLPNDVNLVSQAVKPGHWYSVRQKMKSNVVDFYGELIAFSGQSDHRPLDVEEGSYRIISRRSVVLPRGQEKSFELTFPAALATGRQVWMYSDLVSRFGASPRWLMSRVLNRMHPHQHQLVVLARRPDAYGYLSTLEAVNSNRRVIGGQPDLVTVIPAGRDRLAPLPSWSLMWTNISYVIWDDFQTAALTDEQREAMLDWLHWGGQLIVSGPESLSSLKSSFLADYLPAEVIDRRQIRAEEVDELDDWTLAGSSAQRTDMGIPRPDATPWEIVELSLRPSAQFVPNCGRLLAERWVGRGRIVVSAFSLTSPPLLKWKCFDNFFNACLLRLPQRLFEESSAGDVISTWPELEEPIIEPDSRSTGASTSNFEPIRASGSRQITPQRPAEAALVTSRLRYFSRDTCMTDGELFRRHRSWDLVGYSASRLSGVAGWNPHSASSELARSAMVQSAGIEVPNRSYILLAIVAYLLVLVPLNWSVFSAIGRVEWAWFAVPVITVLGTIGVVRVAQLNLGFARSRTELAIVETQPGYSRAHVTRYSGLYTSLSTKYECDFADACTVASPFSVGKLSGPESSTGIFFERPDVRDARVRLGGLSVPSNSTRIVHSEAMVDVGGPFELTESSPGFWKVSNSSKFDLFGVGVIRRDQRGFGYAEVGDLPAGASYRIAFRRVTDGEKLSDRWRSFGIDVRQPETPIDLQPFLELAVEPSRIRIGDACLVGWMADEVPGLLVRPAASQKKFRTLWLSHLAYGPMVAPKSDFNSIADLNQGFFDDRAN